MTFTLPATQIPLNTAYDVIVIGGGPAGCTAAAAAAREGARTLLLEVSGALGGSGTSALVPAWCPFSDKQKIIYRGLAERVFNASKDRCAHIAPDRLDWVPIDPEKLKRVYDDLIIEFGVDVLFHTMLAHVVAEPSADRPSADRPRKVSTIITASKAGLCAYQAKVFIDCTGDADLCAWAGAEFMKGDEDGNLMAATHCFIIANVDMDAYRKGPQLHPNNPNSPVYAILESGKYPIPDRHLCNNQIGPGAVGFNAGHVWNVDNTDPATVSRALIEGRKLAAAYRDALAEYHPAFAGGFLVATGAQIGIRETRRIIGDYILTLDDYLERRSFDDEICRNSYFIDVHGAKKANPITERAANEESEKRTFRYGPGESHGLPYRCLTPRDLTNVLVAGRSVSTERQVNGSVRVMPVCLAMGEAAGIAAALAVQIPTHDVHQVNVQQLRARIREEGGYLP